MKDLPLFSRIRITTDDYIGQGAPRGTIGFIIEAYDDEAYEIEVSDSSGVTVALFAARADHVTPAE